MQKRHTNRQQYFEEQGYTTQKYVIPFVEEFLTIDSNTKVLEIGCGEGGNMKPFLDRGCKVVGVDINGVQLERAAKFFDGHLHQYNLELIHEDIYNVSAQEIGQFDLIMMRDVIEHIPNQEKFMGYVKQFLKKEGKFFLGFPPWQMPFGGHQQGCRNKILSKLPYYHLLPNPIYKAMLRGGGERELVVNNLLEVKETGISIERFKRILKAENYTTEKYVFYLINPNYEAKFDLKPRTQLPVFGLIPYIRNFVTTCCYYLLSKKEL